MFFGGAFPDPADYIPAAPPPHPPPARDRDGGGPQRRARQIFQYNVWGSPYGTQPGQRVRVAFDAPYTATLRAHDILADPFTLLLRRDETIIPDIEGATAVAEAMLAVAILRAFYYIWYVRTSGASPAFRRKNMADEAYMLESVYIAREALNQILTRINQGNRNLRDIFDVGKLNRLVDGMDPANLYPYDPREEAAPWQRNSFDIYAAPNRGPYDLSYGNLLEHFNEVMRRFYKAEFVEAPLRDPTAPGANFIPNDTVGRPAFLLDPQATTEQFRTRNFIANYPIPRYAYSRFPIHYLTH